VPNAGIDQSPIAHARDELFKKPHGRPRWSGTKLSFLQQRSAMRKLKRHFTLRALLETRANVIRCAHRLPVGEKRTQLRRFGIQIRALCRNSTWLNANVIDGPLLPDRKPAAKLPVE
jgi:hypothetical protein